MGIISWLLFGLLAGAIARLAVPGRQSIGCLGTLAVGMVGALIGGLIGQVVLGHGTRFHWALGPFLLAVLGAIVLLLVLEAVRGKRGRFF